MIVLIIALLLSVIFLLISALHFYWAFGGKWGGSAALPTNDKGDLVLKPTVFDTAVVALVLLFISIFFMLLAISESTYLSAKVTNYILWILMVVFLLRSVGEFRYVGFFKRVKDTQFANLDTRYYSPLCLIISLLTFVLQFCR